MYIRVYAWIIPGPGQFKLDETDVITIDVTASDADEQSSSYTIKIDGVTCNIDSSYSWTTDYTSACTHTIEVTINDGIGETTAQRTITVNNVHPRLDVNQDGVVNILDMTITSSHFGETGVE